MKNKNLDDYMFYSLLISVIFLIIMCLIYKYFFNYIHIGYCFIFNNFGFYCPGCGCTRAFESFLHFDFIKSIYYNPAVMYALVITFIYLFTQTIDRIFKNQKHIMPYSNMYLYIGIFILLINCLIKNILLLFFNITI